MEKKISKVSDFHVLPTLTLVRGLETVVIAIQCCAMIGCYVIIKLRYGLSS